MTLEKMDRILLELKANPGIKLYGCVLDCTGGGELRLTLNTQPQQGLHNWLMKKGFICNDGEYIYRPIR